MSWSKDNARVILTTSYEKVLLWDIRESSTEVIIYSSHWI